MAGGMCARKAPERRSSFAGATQNQQVITLLSVTSEQFEILKESGYEHAKSIVGEKISLRLHSLSLDPAKRDKALITARKLGIDLE